MGSFQSKGNASSPHTRSPRYSSIGGRLQVNSPSINNNFARQQHHHGSSSRLGLFDSPTPGSPGFGLKGSRSLGKLPASEFSPLIQPKSSPAGSSPRMLSEHEVHMVSPPPLAVWIGPALACALAYALYNIFIKKGSASINPILGGVILQFVAALLGCLLLGGVVWYNASMAAQDGFEQDPEEQFLMWDWVGVKWAILAGCAVGAAEMISFCVSGMGVQAMQSIPIIIGGSVMFGTVLGYVALGESLTTRGWTGVLLISIGISLVGMDDTGEGMH